MLREVIQSKPEHEMDNIQTEQKLLTHFQEEEIPKSDRRMIKNQENDQRLIQLRKADRKRRIGTYFAESDASESEQQSMSKIKLRELIDCLLPQVVSK